MADDPQTSSAPVDPSATAPTGTTAAIAAIAAAETVIEKPADLASASAVVAAADDPNAILDEAAIDELLRQAEFQSPADADPSSGHASGAATNNDRGPMLATEAFDLPNFQQVMADAQVSSIDLLRDVELNVKIELGRSRMLVEDVLKLGEGSVVELDKLAGDPVDVFVNDRLVARGEVLVLNESFCVRVNEIVAGLKDEGN